MGPFVICVASVFSALLFALTAWFTRASYWRVAAALMGGLVAAALSLGWDVLAFEMGWWRYGYTKAHAPITAYAPVLFWFGGGMGLIGWRMIRSWGAPGEIGFFLLFPLVGLGRDLIFAAGTGTFTFGPTPWSIIMDLVAWLSIAFVVQLVMQLLVGPVDGDALAPDRIPPPDDETNPEIINASLQRCIAASDL
ncbi:MAG: hypothetical protein Q8L66_10405 [Caulobacter sp.]|nr:hypothetical protein [Caulobacter sp.]